MDGIKPVGVHEYGYNTTRPLPPLVTEDIRNRNEFINRAALASITGLLANTADDVTSLPHGQVAKLAYDFAEAMWVEQESRRT